MSQTHQKAAISRKLETVDDAIVSFVGAGKPGPVFPCGGVVLVEGGEAGASATDVPETNCAVAAAAGEDVGLDGGPADGDDEARVVADEGLCYPSCAQVEESDRRVFGTACC
jgi:hypothetical protein